jgi:hypothetical protein
MSLQIEDIASHIRDGLCVPFFGAAANLTVEQEYEGLLIGAQLAETLAGDLKDIDTERRNLARVSLILERVVSRPFLIRKVKDLLPDRDRQPSLLLQTMAQLPLDLYITTNYDRLLEKALAHRNPLVVVQTAGGIDNAEAIDQWIDVQDDAERPPLIYKIHGSFMEPVAPGEGEHGAKPVDRSQLIITEDDYIDLMTLLSSEAHAVPSVIRRRLTTCLLLFLGYSLEDWDFRALYKVIINGLPDKNFKQAAYSVQREVKDYWKRFWDAQGVRILEQDIYEFARELRAEFPQIFCVEAGTPP